MTDRRSGHPKFASRPAETEVPRDGQEHLELLERSAQQPVEGSVPTRPCPWGASCSRRFDPNDNGQRGDVMAKKKIWFITGAGRGMGVDFAKAALAAGHAVVATGRDTAGVSRALGHSDDLL